MATHHMALEMGTHQVRVLIAEVGKTTITPQHILTLPISDSPGAEPPGETLAATLKSLKITPQRTVVILPRATVTSRTVMLPSVDPEELATMARFEAEKHIPFNAERHSIAHHVMRTEGIEGSEVFLAAVDQPVVDRVLGAAKEHDITIDEITVSSVTSHSALLLAEPEAIRGRTIAMVVVGNASTDISVIRDGELLITRGVPGGVLALVEPLGEEGESVEKDRLSQMAVGSDVPDPGRGAHLQHHAERIGTEIRRTQEFTRREFNTPQIEEVVVTGQGALVGDFAEAIGRSAGIAARRLDMHAIGKMCEAKLCDEDTLSTHAVCLGALLPPPEGAITLNLTPSTYTQARATLKLRQMAMISGALAFVALLLVIVFLKVALGAARDTRRDLQAQIREMGPRVDEIDNMRAQIDIIENLINDENSALAILNRISGLAYVPPRAYSEDNTEVRLALDLFRYDRDAGMVEIDGYARDEDDVIQFRQDMEGTGWFAPSTVKLDNLRRSNWPQRGEITEFTIRCQLLQPESATSNSRSSRRGRRR